MNQEISDLLESAIKDSIDNYVVTIGEGNKKGEGYLGEFIILKLTNKKTNQVFNLAIKQSTFDTSSVNLAFDTEIYVYAVLWPKLQEIQKTYAPGLTNMNLLPKCLATNSKTVKKRLILENLKLQNFEIYDRTKCFDRDHMELVFKNYGKFHALSFAFKSKEPENFKKLTQQFDDQIEPFEKLVTLLIGGIRKFFYRLSKEYQGEHQNEIREKMAEYAAETKEKLAQVYFYKGDYSVILHGDCWSNNFFFKYDDSRKPVQMKFIDLQLSRTASPVQDLSYAFYCGASKEILADLDHYLKVYYESLSNTLKVFNCDVKVLYPFSVLKEQWKTYCKVGFMISILVWAAKLMISNVPTLGDKETHNDDDHIDETSLPVIDEVTYFKVSRDLLIHMYENNFL